MAKPKPPVPFVKAPTSLGPFLAQLDPSLVYIVHIDSLPSDTKRRIFFIPVVLNAVIAALLIWRLWVAAPVYYVLALTMLGYPTSATVDPDTTTRRQQVSILLRRFLMFAFDFLLFRYIGPWPLTFFLEQPANPVTWRWQLGFLPREAVVRVSRNWGANDLMRGAKKGEESPFFKTRILPAIDRQHLRKTGYILMDGSWDLDFQAMLDAHTLDKRNEVKLSDIDRHVFVHSGGSDGWLIWKFETEQDLVEERRMALVKFKDHLTNMGKESLFFKWMEIVEEERDRDGGFTEQGQKNVKRRVEKEFEKHGVDFDQLSKAIGLELPEASTGDGKS
ncbi:hypothetical protein K470DRAFT_258435 [Piedraia hortae CBS 480.64]|uniref:Uncharacterized protein n=1 Tax=Piedraia hortae CBS 480.64 TaxID=1314780 RepID=A0A6A7BXW3_9PEZI|nr:hypothetical protein K470DRAFT_258435 [Piedraia hortae CBS 480.64]